jgi:hypothetical protein
MSVLGHLRWCRPGRPLVEGVRPITSTGAARQKVIESAIDRLVHALDQQTLALNGIGATLDDILDALTEANEARRAANGERPTEDDEVEDD